MTVANSPSSNRALCAAIDLAAIAHNFRVLQAAVGTGVEIWACLKGDGYGCGIRRVAPCLSAAGAKQFAVGNIDDAIAIRRLGLSQPILLYPNILPDSSDVVRDQTLTITLSSLAEAEAWAAVGGPPVDAFVKIDTGAFRGGVLARDAGELGRFLARSEKFRIKGAYGHLFIPAPAPSPRHAAHQLQTLLAGVAALESAGVPVPVRMVSGSAGVLQWPEMDLDAVDPGRMLFGLGVAETRRAIDLRPVLLSLKARLLLVKSVTPEDAAGFPAPFPLDRPMRVGLISFGWSDGCPRQIPAGMCALVRGRRAPLLGPVHFEHVRIDLTDVPEARFGDDVVLIGSDGDARIDVADAARLWGTTPLEVLGGLRSHIHRTYHDTPADQDPR